MPQNEISTLGIKILLENFKHHKASGPDNTEVCLCFETDKKLCLPELMAATAVCIGGGGEVSSQQFTWTKT